jgi:glutamate/tyrosine decarboxylase-like PLP-dependent enzyme
VNSLSVSPEVRLSADAIRALRERPANLDPDDWTATREQAHRMLDDVLDHLQTIRERPVWQPMPESARERFREPAPEDPTDLADVHDAFRRLILPYGPGNTHPGFMGWVQGAGTVPGMLAEMLAAGLNANVGGRDQAALEVQRQILQWVREWFAFPATAGGLFVTGASMANFVGVLVARGAALGAGVRHAGLQGSSRRLVAYASQAVHTCVPRAMEMSGLGSDALRAVPTGGDGRLDLAALRAQIAADRSAGLSPFLVVGSAGTVDIGAVDDLDGMAAIARDERMWFHVDGAIGALGVLAPSVAPKLAGIERADSIALDFHKWGQVPYDAGYILVRDGAAQLRTFATPAAYLQREHRGLSAGSPWPCDLGPDLSRSFRALKTWFTVKTFGTRRIGAAIDRTCALAQYLGQRVAATPELELLAPVALNIVCFRYRSPQADQINAEIVVAQQESGLVAPSTTTIGGRLAIRAAIVNHRTRVEDIDRLVASTLAFGRAAARTCAPSERKVS